jgi:hypothetical protein
MYIKEIGWEKEVTDLARDKEKWPYEHSGYIKCVEFFE